MKGDQQHQAESDEHQAQAEPRAEAAGAEGEDAELSHEQLLLTLQDAKAKADEYWNQLLLARAELENTRKRAERDVENAHKFALEGFVKELLPVKDSLELALAALADTDEGAQQREGVELTLKMLAGVLAKFGVEEVNPEGEKFNPERHQAMSMQDAPGTPANTVLTVYQKGYLLNDRLVRPALVVVASGAAGDGGGGGDEGGGKGTHIDEQA
ncbi:MAG TPA: nucleotide exchange factor GrpE [Gammaproteobacteria bacterium]|nr:nucleotide exchange factor GrpE [Gammaproteobacteria bacterium]